MATFTRKQQNKDNKEVKTTQSTVSPTIHMNAHQWRSQHQVLEAETDFALAELGESRGKKHPSFSKDDLETQMPSGRGSTSTALKKANITSAQVTTAVLGLTSSGPRADFPPSRWACSSWPTASKSISHTCHLAGKSFKQGALFNCFSQKNSKKLVTGQYFVFLGGTEKKKKSKGKVNRCLCN